jgi:predicted transcriptional regulator of viral defense system
MAKSTYISKALTQEHIDFLRKLNDHEILYFSLNDIQDTLGELYPNLNEIVENLNNKKILKRIERSKYALSNYNDPYVLSNFIAPGSIVAYWSALHLHGLTERFPNKIFVKIPNRKRAADIFGTKIQFVSVANYKMTGRVVKGYGDQRFTLSDVESTIVDCFDQPRYAGDWPDLLRAFNIASMRSNKLISYSQSYANAAIIKRMGYLAELCHKKELKSFIDFALKYPLNKYSLFEPGGNDQGKHNLRWRIRQNMSEENILSCLNEDY